METFLLIVGYCLTAGLARVSARTPFPSSLVDLVLIGIGAYHVAPEAIRLILDLSPGPYRGQLPREAISNWLLLITPSIVLFGLGTRLAIRRPIQLPPARLSAERMDVVDLAFTGTLVLGAITLSVMVIAGRAFGGFDSGNYLAGSVVSAALVPALTSVAVLAVLRGRFPLFTILSVLTVLCITGSRWSVGGSLLSGLVIVRRCGWAVPTRRIVPLAVLVSSIFMSIALVREIAGRGAADASLVDLTEAVSDAGEKSVGSVDWHQLIDVHFVHRLDGNGYGAAILNAQERLGVAPMGMSAITNSLNLATPSMLWPAKLEIDIARRNQELASIYHHGIEEIDYLPTVLGAAVSIFGWLGAPIVAWVAGIAVALADRHLAVKKPYHLPVAVGLCLVSLGFEGNIETVIIGVRGIVVLAVLVFVGRLLASAIGAVARCGMWQRVI